MALEKPVIATDSGGNREIVLDDFTGLLVEPFKTDQIVLKLNLLLDRPNLLLRMGVRGKARIMESFSLVKMAGDYYRLYTEIIENRKTSRSR
jgi:glycosyltransferase involved in cell wall biosynthesis